MHTNTPPTHMHFDSTRAFLFIWIPISQTFKYGNLKNFSDDKCSTTVFLGTQIFSDPLLGNGIKAGLLSIDILDCVHRQNVYKLSSN